MKCIEIFKHDIPNPVLNDIKDIGGLVEYYLTEVKDESPLELIANQPKANLPQNLHINLEYTRFDPETDKFFDGKDAFANRNTIVSSLWYSKKYKSVFKKKSIFEK
jgi:large subunit ribosomal protein L50